MMASLAQEFIFLRKTGRAASFGNSDGSYPFFTSSQELTKRTDVADCEGPALVFGTGGAAALHYVEGPFSATNDCYIVVPKSGRYEDAKYFYYYLKRNIHLIEKGFRGAGLKHVSKKHLEAIELSINSEINRSKIVSVLDRAESIEKQRFRLAELAEELLRASFLHAFGDPRKVRGAETTLADVADIARGRFSPRPRNDPRFYDGDYPFIQTGEIARSDGYMGDYRQTLNSAGIKVSKSFPKGTVFMAIVGATIGATSISTREFWCPDSVVGIVPKTEEYPAEFIEYLLRFWRPVFVDRAPETARANINLQTLRPVPIPLDRHGKARQFAELYRRLHKLKSDLNGLDATLRASLSQQAFRGEL